MQHSSSKLCINTPCLSNLFRSLLCAFTYSLNWLYPSWYPELSALSCHQLLGYLQPTLQVNLAAKCPCQWAPASAFLKISISLPSPQYATRTPDSLQSCSIRDSVTTPQPQLPTPSTTTHLHILLSNLQPQCRKVWRQLTYPFCKSFNYPEAHLKSWHDIARTCKFFTGIPMTERTDPSSLILWAYFHIQHMGFATSKSFQIPSILLKGNMLPADTGVPWKSISRVFPGFRL